MVSFQKFTSKQTSIPTCILLGYTQISPAQINPFTCLISLFFWMSHNYLKLNYNRMELMTFQKKPIPYYRSWLTVPTATKLPWSDFFLTHPRSSPSHLHVLFRTALVQCPTSLPFLYHLLQKPFLKFNSDVIPCLTSANYFLPLKNHAQYLAQYMNSLMVQFLPLSPTTSIFLQRPIV